jgi:outer membrane biosynthesis protein TonB
MALTTFTEHSGNERKSLVYTIIITIAIALILFFWKIRYEETIDPGGGGIEIDFGNSATGLGVDNSSLGEPAPMQTETYVPAPTPVPPTPTPTKSPEVKPVTPSPPKVSKTTSTMTSSNADAIAIEKKKKEEDKIKKAADAQEKAIADAKASADAQTKAVAQAKAIADAKAKAEAEKIRKEQEEFAQKMQGGLNNINKGNGSGGTGSGSGQGTTKPGGNQGDPGGSMNGGNGNGGSGGGSGGGNGTGSGSGSGSGSSIGNHTLAGRSMISKPSLINASRALGRIMIKVSVDKNGNVLTAAFASQGSTTNDEYLIQLSVTAAKKIKFSASPTGAEEQFGVVPFNYTP